MTPRVVVMMAARNEEAHIAEAVNQIRNGTRPPDRIVVLANNCTDDTARVATEAGAEVLVTRPDGYKKAGALNQGIAWLMPGLDDEDFILEMDADVRARDDLIANALAHFSKRPELGA